MGTESVDLRFPLRMLDWSFGFSIVMVAWLFWISSQDAGPESAAGLAIVMVLSGLVFWIALGTLAHRQGRRPIVWVGLAFITSPLGPIVAYLWMRGVTADAIAENAAEH